MAWPDTSSRAHLAAAQGGAPGSALHGGRPGVTPGRWPQPERRVPRTTVGAHLQMRWRAWWDRRNPRRDTLALSHHNVYILPTRAGGVFAVTLGVLLLASINYQLSLGYVLTFLLAGSAAVAMHVTHRTLRGLTLHLRPPSAVFSGGSVTVECVLADLAQRDRFGIGLRLMSGATGAAWAWVDVPAGGQSTARLAAVVGRRGSFHLPTVRIETRFPLGLFRAWSEWRPVSAVLAYPKPEQPAAALPSARPVIGLPNAQHAPGGETDGVRTYRRGDPLQRVLWKKAARAFEAGGELVSRDTTGSARQELWLDWADTRQPGSALDPEARLSRLTAWVLECDRRGIDWGLRLPGTELAPASGDAHRRAGLTAMALCQT